MSEPTIVISEIYGPVIQGEGIVAGKPTIFVRTGGCDYLCSWCDSLYAVDAKKYKGSWQKLGAEAILVKCQQLAPAPMLITLSGGNPALQPCGDLIDLGHKLGYTFAIETQGSKFPDWATALDSITLSPKPPSSGMITDWKLLSLWLSQTPSVPERCLKVVVFDETDFGYANAVREYARSWNVPMFLQAGTSNPYGQTDTFDGMSVFREAILQRTALLGDWVIREGWHDVRVLPQIHALLYGAKRGV